MYGGDVYYGCYDEDGSGGRSCKARGGVQAAIGAEEEELEGYGVAKRDWDKCKASGRVRQVEQTYEAAMTWLNGRHESFFRQANLSLAEWRASMAEQSLSALFLTMWLADDLQTELDHDVT